MTLSGNGDHILRQIAALRLAYHGDKIPKRKAEDRETFEALHKAGLITDRGVLTEKGRGEAGALPMEVEVITLIKVSHSEIDRFISSRYGHEFEAVLDQGWANDSSYEVQVKKGKLDTYRKGQLDKFKRTGKGSFLLPGLLMDLCNQDDIPPGRYLISVCW